MGEKQARTIQDQVDKGTPRNEAVGAFDMLIPSLIDQLGQLDELIIRVEEKAAYHLRNSPYRLRTMPGLGDALAAIFEAEVGQIERLVPQTNWCDIRESLPLRTAPVLAVAERTVPMEDAASTRPFTYSP